MTAPLRQTMPLNSLVNVRSLERDRHRVELADSQRRLAESENDLRRILSLLEDIDQKAGRYHCCDITSISQLAQMQRYRKHLWENKQSITGKCNQLATEISVQRQQLIEAERELQIVERLCGKRLLDQQQQQALQEVRASDEIAGQRFYRDRPAA